MRSRGRSVEELIDALAARSAAAQRMLNSMSPEQREELMALSQQAFGSPELSEQLGRLDGLLQTLRPGEDWDGSRDFEGSEGLGMSEGVAVMSELGDLDRLAEQLAQVGDSPLSELDLEAVDRHLGRDAAVSVQTLARLEQQMRDSGYLSRRPDGDLRLSPSALRKLGRSLLRDAAQRLSGRGRWRPGWRGRRGTDRSQSPVGVRGRGVLGCPADRDQRDHPGRGGGSPTRRWDPAPARGHRGP